jgi:hypothetical protein
LSSALEQNQPHRLPARTAPHQAVTWGNVEPLSLSRHFELVAHESIDLEKIMISDVVGTSMEPLIYQGDYLVIDLRPEVARDGDVVTVRLPDRSWPVCGILRDGDSGPWLQKMNCPDMILVDGWSVQGVVLLIVAQWDHSSRTVVVRPGATPSDRHVAGLACDIPTNTASPFFELLRVDPNLQPPEGEWTMTPYARREWPDLGICAHKPMTLLSPDDVLPGKVVMVDDEQGPRFMRLTESYQGRILGEVFTRHSCPHAQNEALPPPTGGAL